MKPTVFIHSNDKQIVGALVSAYSLKRNSRHADAFDVRILEVKDFPFLGARHGQPFLRGGVHRLWDVDDLQSFTPLRFAPPELMGFAGRAVLIDPDIFAVGDVWELLSRNMEGKALMCRARYGHNGRKEYLASSVMLLDCAKLGHWRLEAQFAEMFAFKRDYLDWISLALEPRETIGLLEEEWNHFDTLNAGTKLLHNTKRRTQPWKTGLPVDFTPRERHKGLISTGWLIGAVNSMLSDASPFARYVRHPDPNQERFFFGLLRECVEQGRVSEDLLRDQIARKHIRADTLALIERASRPLAA
ncbi:MAG TPA: hypothetical protein VFE11_06090 [Dongiaceae bacterium]|nr:hypothetical protein [Dongiaceae bacterium]